MGQFAYCADDDFEEGWEREGKQATIFCNSSSYSGDATIIYNGNEATVDCNGSSYNVSASDPSLWKRQPCERK